MCNLTGDGGVAYTCSSCGGQGLTAALKSIPSGKWHAEKPHSTTRRYKDARIWPQLTILSLWTRRRSSCRPTAWLRPRFLPGLPGLSAHKLVQHWSRTPADRPTFPPRRLLVPLPHHGEWWEPARAVRRGAAHGSGGRDAFSASRSAGRAGPRVIEGEAKSGNEEVGRGSGEVETKEKKKLPT